LSKGVLNWANGERRLTPCQAFKAGVTTMGDECSPVGVEIDTTSKRTTYSGGIAHQVRRDSLKGGI